MKTLAAVLALGCLFWASVAAAGPTGHVSGFETLNSGHVLGGPAPLLERPAYPHASGDADPVPTSGILDNVNLGCPDTLLGLEVACDGGVTDGGGGGLRGLDSISERSSSPAPSRSSSRPSRSAPSRSSPSNDSPGGGGSGGGGGCRG